MIQTLALDQFVKPELLSELEEDRRSTIENSSKKIEGLISKDSRPFQYRSNETGNLVHVSGAINAWHHLIATEEIKILAAQGVRTNKFELAKQPLFQDIKKLKVRMVEYISSKTVSNSRKDKFPVGTGKDQVGRACQAILDGHVEAFLGCVKSTMGWVDIEHGESHGTVEVVYGVKHLADKRTLVRDTWAHANRDKDPESNPFWTPAETIQYIGDTLANFPGISDKRSRDKFKFENIASPFTKSEPFIVIVEKSREGDLSLITAYKRCKEYNQVEFKKYEV